MWRNGKRFNQQMKAIEERNRDQLNKRQNKNLNYFEYNIKNRQKFHHALHKMRLSTFL